MEFSLVIAASFTTLAAVPYPPAIIDVDLRKKTLQYRVIKLLGDLQRHNPKNARNFGLYCESDALHDDTQLST